MTSTTHRPVNLDQARDLSVPALIAALVAIPGSTLAWGTVPGEGWLFGIPAAVLGLVLGLQSAADTRAARIRSRVAIAISVLMLLQMVVYGSVESFTGGIDG